MILGFSRASSGPPPAYVGPGDVVASATSWWGLRGYNAAYAAPGTNPAMDVVDSATGLITTTCAIKTDGSLDVATILGLGYGVSVKKLYDQTGNGHHMLQSTLANMPTITLSGLGSLPISVWVNGTTMVESGTTTITQPFTISSVDKSVNPSVNSTIWKNTGLAFYYHNASSANERRVFITSVVSQGSIADGSFHAVQAIINGGSSRIDADGVTGTTGNPGSTTINAAQALGPTTAAANIQEVGYWASAFSAGDSTAMNSNQHTYWGF